MFFRKLLAKLAPFIFGSEDEQMEWMSGVLRKICPEAPSVEQRARIIARALTRKGHPVDPRTVRNWAQKHSAPAFRYIGPILGLWLLEKALDAIEPEGESPNEHDLARSGAHLPNARPPRQAVGRRVRSQS